MVRVGQILLVLVWIVALGYLGLVVLRFVAFDATSELAILERADAVGLPARPGHRVRGVVLPAHRASESSRPSRWCSGCRWSCASIGSVQAVPDAVRAGPHLRLLTANVRYTNPTPGTARA